MTPFSLANRPLIQRTLNTGYGTVIVEGPIDSAKLQDCGILDGLKAFRPAWRQREALVEIAASEDSWVVAAVNNAQISGYITFHPPGEFERWGRAGIPEILELGAIEVAPEFRNSGLGRVMMQVAFADPIMENFIVISTEYYWHWDLEGTGLNVWDYQGIMTKLMEGVGMSKRDTDEQEISSHPANMLMVKVGSKVPAAVVADFENLLVRRPKTK
ncbi:MAG: GNAT family N-acetyltransferase [Peptococcaceae bacterium]|nr:GNAT family N-acetyltransferase [Peptococcaceae bacterium]